MGGGGFGDFELSGDVQSAQGIFHRVPCGRGGDEQDFALLFNFREGHELNKGKVGKFIHASMSICRGKILMMRGGMVFDGRVAFAWISMDNDFH